MIPPRVYVPGSRPSGRQEVAAVPTRIRGPTSRPSGREEVINPALLEEELRTQAESARYAFASAVNDGIYDNSHVRQEVRDGLKTTGMYAFSDGYFKRTVHYEADENGYRVVK